MRVVAIAGSSSNVGKTTLACELLRRLPGWEAVKVTKGHFRSCGKDPHACCVSHLLSDRPLVASDRARTDVPGKDTGRYWAAGAAGVHWVVATRDAVAEGVREALARVRPGAPGVLVEGTGFVLEVDVDLAVMAIGSHPRELKASALRALPRMDVLYAGAVERGDTAPEAALARLLGRRGVTSPLPPLLFEPDLGRLAAMAASGRGKSSGLTKQLDSSRTVPTRRDPGCPD